MEAIAAFSLACNVIQVVHCGIDVVSNCRELGTEGSLSEYEPLEHMANHLTSLRNALDFPLAQGNQNKCQGQDQALLDLAEKCSTTAKELSGELQKLKIKGPHRKRQIIRNSAISLWKDSSIEKIQTRLDEYRKILDSRILIGIRQQLNQIVSQENAAFQELNSKLQKIAISAAAESKSSDQLSQLLQEESTLVKHHLSKAIEQGNAQFVKRACQRQFLENLYFPEIHARQEEIADAHKETFHWIFEQVESGSGHWDNFIKWLESGSRTYWISGKAGSGKSTLVNYVYQHPRTQRCLEIWSAGRTLITPKFFFWNPGSSMQKSIQGLLRSLIYQILVEDPDSITRITNFNDTSRDAFARVHAWTERRLIRTLLEIIQNVPKRRCICLFVDGLDEYSGDQNALVDLIEELVKYPNVKCCVSSRPYRAFTDAFGSGAMLKLHDLTEPDIRAYVSNKFEALHRADSFVTFDPSRISQLGNDIIRKAEGVFLWVNLAVKD